MFTQASTVAVPVPFDSAEAVQAWFEVEMGTGSFTADCHEVLRRRVEPAEDNGAGAGSAIDRARPSNGARLRPGPSDGRRRAPA